MIRTRHILGTLVALLILGESTAEANMRAPRLLPEHGASTLINSGNHLTVQKEDLSFQCGARSCDVEASYAILSTTSGTFDLQFISASSQLPVAEVNGDTVLVSLVQIKSTSPGHSSFDRGRVTPTWNAKFRAKLVEGENRITVRHLQPLGLSEIGQSYFRASRYTADFRYEVWPLKEWSLAPGFAISLKITITEKRSFWHQLFRRRTVVKCYEGNKGDDSRDFSTPLPLQVNGETKNQTMFQTELGLNFPERLWCSIRSKETTSRGRKKYSS